MFQRNYHANIIDFTFPPYMELLNAELFVTTADRLSRCSISLPCRRLKKAMERDLHLKMGPNGWRRGGFRPAKLVNLEQIRFTFKTLALCFIYDH